MRLLKEIFESWEWEWEFSGEKWELRMRMRVLRGKSEIEIENETFQLSRMRVWLRLKVHLLWLFILKSWELDESFPWESQFWDRDESLAEVWSLLSTSQFSTAPRPLLKLFSEEQHDVMCDHNRSSGTNFFCSAADAALRGCRSRAMLTSTP